MSFLSADCAKIAVENPTPLKIVELPPYKGQPRGVFELDERFAREDRDT